MGYMCCGVETVYRRIILIGNWEVIYYLLISRDFKNCMVIRAIYFKVFALANR